MIAAAAMGGCLGTRHTPPSVPPAPAPDRWEKVYEASGKDQFTCILVATPRMIQRSCP